MDENVGGKYGGRVDDGDGGVGGCIVGFEEEEEAGGRIVGLPVVDEGDTGLQGLDAQEGHGVP